MTKKIAALIAGIAVGTLIALGLTANSAGADANCTPLHDRFGDEWVKAEGTHWQGDQFDLIGGGTRTVGPDALVSVGGTTYVVWPCLHGVGTS